MATEYREREDKFDVGATFVMPPLFRLVPEGGRLDVGETALESTYFDTADRALLQRKLTLRRREGESDAGWQLKVPDGQARTEVRLPLDSPNSDPGDGAHTAHSVPDELTELLTAVTLGRELRPTAIIRTERLWHRVLDSDDTVLLELADDTVHASALGDAATFTQWREIEVEIGSGTEQQLAKAGQLLIAAGATRSTSASKLSRALSIEPELPTAPQSIADLVVRYLGEQRDAMVMGDIALRRGQDAIHLTRVGVRRLRSTLRTFGALFDPAEAAELDAELSWYAGVLGAVRDPQVQSVRFANAIEALPPELVMGPVAADIHQRLLTEELLGRAELADVLGGDRYAELMRDVSQLAGHPPISGAGPVKTVERFVKKSERKFVKRLVAALGPAGSDDDLHSARKAAKRARYAAELAAPALGRKAGKRRIEAGKRAQDLLGEHQDSMVAADLLRRFGADAGTTGGHNGFTYGLLYAREQAAAAESRTRAAKLLR
jgi:CHAD domain-containing protein